MKELFERVKASQSSLKDWRNVHTSTEWKEASKVNEILNGIPLNRSRNCECIEDLFFQLNRVNINQIIHMKQEQKFNLPKGTVITLHGCQVITENSTDEQMMNLLKLSPAHIVKFTKYPDNWKELVGGKAKPKAAAPSDDTPQAPAPKDVDDDGGLSDREEELLGMKNQELQDLLIRNNVDLPEKINKRNLVNAVLKAEA
jgi:hypothetical protein